MHRLAPQPIQGRHVKRIDAEVPHVDEGFRLPDDDQRRAVVADQIMHGGPDDLGEFRDDLFTPHAEPDDEAEHDRAEGAEAHRVHLDVECFQQPLHQRRRRAVHRAVEQQKPGSVGDPEHQQDPERLAAIGQDGRLEIHVKAGHAEDIEEGDGPEDDV
ncbi:hypothetical protein D9M72_519340 [compost metagenome]